MGEAQGAEGVAAEFLGAEGQEFVVEGESLGVFGDDVGAGDGQCNDAAVGESEGSQWESDEECGEDIFGEHERAPS